MIFREDYYQNNWTKDIFAYMLSRNNLRFVIKEFSEQGANGVYGLYRYMIQERCQLIRIYEI